MGLSDNGHRQAARLAEHLRGQSLDAIYASPMKRVQQTLLPLLNERVLVPVILPDLRELDFGDWTGLSWDEVLAKYGVSASSWLVELEHGRMPRAEPLSALRQRVEVCLNRILSQHPGGQVAVFCHGGVIRVILALLLGWPLSQLSPFELEYASLTQAACAPHCAQLRLLNFTPWRELGA